MLLCDLIQSHYPKILMLSPVPCNLHRNIIVILTTQSRLSPSHIPLIRSLSRSISRTLIAITVDADMAAKISKISNILPHFQNLPRILLSCPLLYFGAKYCLFCLFSLFLLSYILPPTPLYIYFFSYLKKKIRDKKSI